MTPANASNASVSQWYNACSAGGTKLYPYGNAYDFGSKCNDLDYNASATLPTGGQAFCQGGYPNLFDMSGNVREWEDDCDTSDQCAQRGGGYLDWDKSSPSAKCTSAELAPRMNKSNERGFRCCWDGT